MAAGSCDASSDSERDARGGCRRRRRADLPGRSIRRGSRPGRIALRSLIPKQRACTGSEASAASACHRAWIGPERSSSDVHTCGIPSSGATSTISATERSATSTRRSGLVRAANSSASVGDDHEMRMGRDVVFGDEIRPARTQPPPRPHPPRSSRAATARAIASAPASCVTTTMRTSAGPQLAASCSRIERVVPRVRVRRRREPPDDTSRPDRRSTADRQSARRRRGRPADLPRRRLVEHAASTPCCRARPTLRSRRRCEPRRAHRSAVRPSIARRRRYRSRVVGQVVGDEPGSLRGDRPVELRRLVDAHPNIATAPMEHRESLTAPGAERDDRPERSEDQEHRLVQ